jgi:hypothetical protein
VGALYKLNKINFDTSISISTTFVCDINFDIHVFTDKNTHTSTFQEFTAETRS